MPDVTGRLRPPRLAAAPASPSAGEVYYDTTKNELYSYNGTAWVPTDVNYLGDWAAGNYVDGDIVVYNGYSYLCVRPTSQTPAPWSTGAGGVAGAMPTGSGCDWFASTAPTGFLICDGSAVSRTTYAALYAVIGTSWGVGDGSTTFNLPDCRGRIVVGLGTHADVSALANNDGAALANRRPKHPHTNGLSWSGSFTGSGGTSAGQSVNHTHGISDPGHSHNITIYNATGAAGDWTRTVDNSGSPRNSPNPMSSVATGITGTGTESATHTHGFTPAGTVSGSLSGTIGASGGTNDTPSYVVANKIIKT